MTDLPYIRILLENLEEDCKTPEMRSQWQLLMDVFENFETMVKELE